MISPSSEDERSMSHSNWVSYKLLAGNRMICKGPFSFSIAENLFKKCIMKVFTSVKFVKILNL